MFLWRCCSVPLSGISMWNTVLLNGVLPWSSSFFSGVGLLLVNPASNKKIISLTCRKYLPCKWLASIYYICGVFSYFWKTLEELECHGPVMSEQTRAELEQKIDEARESIRKAEVRRKLFWHVQLLTTEGFMLQLFNFVCGNVSF